MLGAGPPGSVLAILLAKKGYKVEVYNKGSGSVSEAEQS